MSGTAVSPNPQKPPPLLLQGIAPHLFNSRAPRTTRRPHPLMSTSHTKEGSDSSMRSLTADEIKIRNLESHVTQLQSRLTEAEGLLNTFIVIASRYASSHLSTANTAAATANMAANNAAEAVAIANAAVVSAVTDTQTTNGVLSRAQQFLERRVFHFFFWYHLSNMLHYIPAVMAYPPGNPVHLDKGASAFEISIYGRKVF
ncbi:hypothetical protein GGX14DRAFT_398768 [Mycena pura]|uniref:Uncharacterized protein n=1 Tax=Mycena pura TaxID=153505 RepID=A0AAD6Y7I5_9AGAR|nr:hypothetical protein GGX14DRAFT_398768 [Mycena pura]